MGRRETNILVGFSVGLAGGLIGLGGAELRLPYLVGVLRLTAHQAVPANLAISLFTILAAVPARLLTLPQDLSPFLLETLTIGAAAVGAAALGARWLRRLSAAGLGQIIFILLVGLGTGMLIEAYIEFSSDGLLPAVPGIRHAAGVLFGCGIGIISSVLGVAGGEVIIPTLVFGYGIPIKAASSLSLIISLPTVTMGILRHARAGAFAGRKLFHELILPMGLASVAGAFIGGLMVGFAPAAAIKIGLGLLLIWSAWKVFANHARHNDPQRRKKELIQPDRHA
jgi:uncharacterized membrane protein YfcA